MGLFSDTKHTHPGVFILESPPRVETPVPGSCHYLDKGSSGGAAHSGICIHDYGSLIGILYIMMRCSISLYSMAVSF